MNLCYGGTLDAGGTLPPHTGMPRDSSSAHHAHAREMDMTQSDTQLNNQELELRAISLWSKQHPDRPWRRLSNLHRYHSTAHPMQGIPAFPEEQEQFRFLASHALTLAQGKSCI